MAVVQLVRLDPEIERTLSHHPDYLEALGAGNWPGAAEVVHRILGRKLTSDVVSVDVLHWAGYFGVDPATRELVGSCAFKTPPRDGRVEIAYFTYPEYEGRGYATAMAQKLIALAAGAPEVREVIAHTLPESNASTRILAKVGMDCLGEVVDPDDGRVWRWRIATS